METITLNPASIVSTSTSTDTNINESAILAVLNNGPQSRTDIIEQTGLPRSTVHACIRRLLDNGDVEEFSLASSTGGRRAALLRLTQVRGIVDVVELGSHHARVGIADLSGKILTATDISLTITDGPDAIIPQLLTTWTKLHHDHSTIAPAGAVGAAVAGPVNPQGHIVAAARMPGWHQTNLAHLLTRATGLPAIIENDARASAIGEWSQREHNTQSSIYVKAGSGIGTSWIADDIVFRGFQGFAGELTHTRVQTSHPTICSCGNTGCLETVASGAAMLRHLTAIGSPITTINEIIEATQNGDYTVTPLVRQAGAYIGEALSGLVNFLNPQRIIIGGSLSQARTLIAGIRSELYQRCLPMSTAHLIVETARAGRDAPLIGMAILAQQHHLTPSV